ncbi:unnamed protein product [Ixodes pacificus]
MKTDGDVGTDFIVPATPNTFLHKRSATEYPKSKLKSGVSSFSRQTQPFSLCIYSIAASFGVYPSSDNDIHCLYQQAHEDNFLHCKEEAPRIQIPHYRSWQDSIGTALRRHVQQYVSVYGSGCEGRRLLSVLLNCCCGSR